MSKDPAFLFYPSDFLTGTMTMTDAQVGKYIRLMCLQHQRGHLGEKQMLSVCKKKDDDIWCKFHQDDNGMYFNARLEEEIGKRQTHSQKQRENIMKRWNKASDENIPPNEIGMQVGNTTVLPLENVNENINRTVVKKEKYGEFKNVLLTEEELLKLETGVPDFTRYIEDLSAYMASKGAKYKSHYAAIRQWAARDKKEGKDRRPDIARAKTYSEIAAEMEGL